METFLECETMYREPSPGHVFVGSLAEIDPRKVAEVVRGSRHIRSLQYSAIRSDQAAIPLRHRGKCLLMPPHFFRAGGTQWGVPPHFVD